MQYTLALFYILHNSVLAYKYNSIRSSLDGSCKSSRHKNAMSRARVVGWEQMAPGEDNLRREVSTNGPVAVLIHAARALFYYKNGLFDGNECRDRGDDVNHYVTLVGYKPDR